MAKLTDSDIERLEAHANRGERWLFVAVASMVGGVVSLAAGAPYFVSLFSCCRRCSQRR